MIELIRDAADSGDIEVLRDAIDWNEMRPDFGVRGVTDPITHFKARSADGTGRDSLAVLKRLLGGPPASMPYGRDLENNHLFVWPRFADATLKDLAGDDLAHFEQLVPAEARAAMLTADRYTGWRLVLGADGTWHVFAKDAVGAKPR